MAGDPVRLRTVLLARALGVTTEEARTVVDVLDTVATTLRRVGWIQSPAAAPRRRRQPPRDEQLSGSLFPPNPLSPSPIQIGQPAHSGSGSLVDPDLTRAPAKPNPCRTGRKTPWPEGFELTESLAAYATRQGLDARYQWGKFKAHALRDDIRHVNWVRAWEYWVRNAWEFQQRRA
ncbi:MAG TPA: hypothetical protein VLK79_12810 [Gaiellales bacterium]|nr:hypothetical protein [Gaiellales bacterium]